VDDLNFMPYYEIRLTTEIDVERFDIFEEGHKSDDKSLDNFLHIDYNKLSRYI